MNELEVIGRKLRINFYCGFEKNFILKKMSFYRL